MKTTLTVHKHLFFIALMCSALLEYVFFESLFQKDVPNGFTIFFVQSIIILGMAWANVVVKKQTSHTWYASGGFALIASLAPLVTSAQLGLMLASWAMILGNIGLLISFYNKQQLPDNTHGIIIWTIIHPAAKIVHGIAKTCEIFYGTWKGYSNKTRANIIGIPLALITILLLATVNPLLKKAVEKIQEALPDFFFWHILIMGIVTLGIFILFIGATHEETPIKTSNVATSRTNWNVILTFLNIPLVLFVILQLATYFMELRGNTTYAYSVAEYATQGVVQAVLATLLCGGMMLLAWKRTEKKSTLSVSSVILSGSLTLLTLVSLSHVFTYIQTFGYTPSRIVGLLGTTAILIAVILGTLIILLQQRIKGALTLLGVLFMTFLSLTPLIQLDALSAEKNIARATKEHPLDSTAIAKLSVEAYPALLTAKDSGVMMEGVLENCKANRSAYNKMSKNITQVLDNSAVRWINQTIPQKNLQDYAQTHNMPEDKCAR